MIPFARRPGSLAPGFPRVSGDEPNQLNLQPVLVAFSPRERG